MPLQRGWRHVALRVALLLALLVNLRCDVPVSADREAMLDRLLAGKTFDLITWTVEAAAVKIGRELVPTQQGMSEAERARFVRDFVARTAEVQRLDAEIERVYLDPAVADHPAASALLRAQRDRARAELNARQSLAEAIVQEQVESALREEGFALGGQVLPPLRFRMTRLPQVLIVSRRDRIERIDQRELDAGLSVDAFDAIEHATEARFNVSALATAIGGLGAYPTMLPESASLQYTIDTAAHEWLHNYLLWSLAPVAVNYGIDPTSRVINETTAVIVQREIGPRVAQRYYPDRAGRSSAEASLATDAAPGPTAFDFNAEMRQTRLRVDELLAEGRITEAETYMEQRRALFVANGYAIRRLNQAWFAFYGAYNAEPGGAAAAGRDPIGPAVQDLRQRSPSLGDFVRAIAGVRNLADIEAAQR